MPVRGIHVNIIELNDKLSGEYGLDLSSDSSDAFREVYVKDERGYNVLVTDVSINDNGDIILEVA